MSIAFPAEQFDTDFPTVREALLAEVRMPVDTQYSMAEAMEICARPITEHFIEAIPLSLLITSVERQDFSRRVHCNVKFRDETVGYAMTEAAWHTLSRKEKFERIHKAVAFDLTNLLLNNLKA